MEEIIPVTRIEQLLAQAAGMSVSAPTPVTRIERLIQQIANKTGYIKPAKVILDVDLQSMPEGGLLAGTVFSERPTSITLIEGQTYTVRLDSGTYTDVCKAIEIEGGMTYYIGNLGGLGFTDNGLPFMAYWATIGVGEYEDIMVTEFEVVDLNSGSHITISAAETVHTIDPKYLPEPVKINLADYGIDIVSATLAGGGTWVVYRPDFWDVVHANSDRDIRFIASMGEADYQLFPSVIAFGDVGGSVAMNLSACMNNVIINANVVFVHYIDEGELIGVECYVAVTQIPIPTGSTT